MMADALERAAGWSARWRESGRLVLLLDFDGTLAPIVERAEEAEMPTTTRDALERLRAAPGVDLAVVSGRALADVRARARLEGAVYAGNHGMEIEGPGLRWTHPGAASARPRLEEAARECARALAGVPGISVEDKGLTLTVHYRRAPRAGASFARTVVPGIVEALPGLRVTEGKEVLEVRPAVEWDKGKAVEFLLDRFSPPPGALALYVGDDRTDEDAFRAMGRWRGGTGAGVLVADPAPERSAATARLRDPAEVAALLRALAFAG